MNYFNNKLKLKLFFSLFFLTSLLVHAQLRHGSFSPSMMPASPQASEFGNYKHENNLYNGLSDVSIPIYSLKTKAFDLPILLTYNSKGRKVNEEATWVGLGWNLNTDYSIIQNVNGFDDYGDYKRRSLIDFDCTIQIQSGLTANSVLSQRNPFYLGFDEEWNAENDYTCYFPTQIYAGIWDSEPDIFTFNILGFSGKFVLDWENGVYKCLNDKNIIVTGNSHENAPSMFIITSPDGNKFYFQLKETSIIAKNLATFELAGAVPSYVFLEGQASSRCFKLIKIESFRGDEVNFSYSSVKDETGQPLMSKNYPIVTKKKDFYTSLNESSFVPSNQGEITSYFATIQNFSYLTNISYNNIDIGFETSERVDLKEGKKLDRIYVKYKNTIKRRFRFDYEYFVANNDGLNWDNYLNYQGYNCEKTEDEITKRLKLYSFTEVAASDPQQNKQHTFQYNSTTLPRKTSYSFDYWGFYNGMHSNNSFYIDIYRFNIERDNRNFANYRNNNHAAVDSFCKAGILEKIIYPTKGSISFEYELNSFTNFKAPTSTQGAQNNFSIYSYGSNGVATQQHQVVISKGGSTLFHGSYLLSTRGSNNSNLYSQTYIKIQRFKPQLIPLVENNQYGLMYAMASMGLLTGSNQTNYNLYIDEVQYILMQANQTPELLVNNFSHLSGEGVILFTVCGGDGGYNFTSNTSQASLSLNFRVYKPLDTISYGAGLRVKKTFIHSGQNKIAFINSYQYSGGKLFDNLIFANKTRESHVKQEIIVPPCTSNAGLISLIEKYYETLEKYIETGLDVHKTDLANLRFQISLMPTQCNLIVLDRYFYGDKNSLSTSNIFSNSLWSEGALVGYDQVTTLQNSVGYASISNGKTIYTFNNEANIGAPSVLGSDYFTDLSIPTMSPNIDNGFLLKLEVFNTQNMKKREEVFVPIVSQQNCFWGLKCIPTDTYLYQLPLTPIKDLRRKYLVGVYPMYGNKTHTWKHRIYNYEENDTISEFIEYSYDSRDQLVYERYENSNGAVKESRLKYAYNIINNNFYQSLVNRNFIEYPVEIDIYSNNELVSSLKKNYEYHVLPFNGFQSIVLRNEEHRKSIDANFEFLNFYNYDNYGNLRSVIERNQKSTIYIYGYTGNYIIAKIEYPTPSPIIPGNHTSEIENASNTGTNADLELAINNLRNSTDPLICKALITSFIYEPLIGITEATYPNLLKTYYYYDGLGRMVETRDKEGYIIERINYNIRPQ